MFITGQYTNPSPRPQLFKDFPDIFIDTFGKYFHTIENTHSAMVWIKDPSIEMMMFLIHFYNPEEKITFEHKHGSNPDVIGFSSEDFLHCLFRPSTNIADVDSPIKNTTISVIVAPNSTINTKDFFQKIDDVTNEYQDEFQNFKPVSLSLTLNRGHKIRAYKQCYANNTLNPENLFLKIITNSWDWLMSRRLIALLPKIFPHIYIPEKYLPIFKYFGEDNYDKWIEAYQKWFKETEILQRHFKNNIEDALTSSFNKQITHIKDKIKHIDSDLRDVHNHLSEKLKQKQQYQATLHGLMNCPDTDTEEVADYILKHPYISQPTITKHNNLSLKITAPLQYYDKEPLEKYLNNPDSRICRTKTTKEIFRKIFTQDKYLLYTAYRALISFKDMEVQAQTDRQESLNFIRQPHMNLNCLGGFKSQIQTAMSNTQYIVAIETLIAAYSQLNFFDGAAVEELAKELENLLFSEECKEWKIIFDKDKNKYLTFHEFLEQENIGSEEKEVEYYRTY